MSELFENKTTQPIQENTATGLTPQKVENTIRHANETYPGVATQLEEMVPSLRRLESAAQAPSADRNEHSSAITLANELKEVFPLTRHRDYSMLSNPAGKLTDQYLEEQEIIDRIKLMDPSVVHKNYVELVNPQLGARKVGSTRTGETLHGWERIELKTVDSTSQSPISLKEKVETLSRRDFLQVETAALAGLSLFGVGAVSKKGPEIVDSLMPGFKKYLSTRSEQLKAEKASEEAEKLLARIKSHDLPKDINEVKPVEAGFQQAKENNNNNGIRPGDYSSPRKYFEALTRLQRRK